MLNIRSKRIINTAIANAVKQSSLVLRPPGLLHCVRNDENCAGLLRFSEKMAVQILWDYLASVLYRTLNMKILVLLTQAHNCFIIRAVAPQTRCSLAVN